MGVTVPGVSVPIGMSGKDCAKSVRRTSEEPRTARNRTHVDSRTPRPDRPSGSPAPRFWCCPRLVDTGRATVLLTTTMVEATGVALVLVPSAKEQRHTPAFSKFALATEGPQDPLLDHLVSYETKQSAESAAVHADSSACHHGAVLRASHRGLPESSRGGSAPAGGRHRSTRIRSQNFRRVTRTR